jgi:photosystem II stability/assembly factor-like uncharacterized protein
MTSDAPSSGDTLVTVGTRKGALLLWRGPGDDGWQRSFHHEGWEVDCLAYDSRDGTLFAATTSAVSGTLVQRSRDLGRSWEHANSGLDYPPGSPHRLDRVWTVQPGPTERPGRVYAGVERAGLFISDDGRERWRAVESLNDHATNQSWQPGGGGLMLHGVHSSPHDPATVYASVSVGGLYHSRDDCESWQPINSGIRADFLPDDSVEAGHCIHCLVTHPAEPGLLYQQNHCGIYRSEDGGEGWTELSEGLPSDFGFAMAIDRHDPNTIFVVPIASTDARLFPESAMQVWRSRDRGEHWQGLSDGLPAEAYFTVMRAAVDTDDRQPSGVYVGTTGGELFYSADGGDHWELLAGSLARVLSVSTATVR